MKKLLTLLAVMVLSVASMSAVEYPDMKYGPWVQNVSETGFTVMWKSSLKNFTWVEVAPDDGTPFEDCTRPRFYNVVHGRRIAGTFHSVKVSGLEAGKSYRYRIYGAVVDNDENAYAVDYGPFRRVKIAGDGVIKTLDKNASKCRFFMINDIHGKDHNYKALTKDVKKSEYDFLVMNGDMYSYISSADSLLRHVFHVVPALTSSIPTVYTRGNHETRGREAHLLQDICLHSSEFLVGQYTFVVKHFDLFEFIGCVGGRCRRGSEHAFAVIFRTICRAKAAGCNVDDINDPKNTKAAAGQ